MVGSAYVPSNVELKPRERLTLKAQAFSLERMSNQLNRYIKYWYDRMEKAPNTDTREFFRALHDDGLKALNYIDQLLRRIGEIPPPGWR